MAQEDETRGDSFHFAPFLGTSWVGKEKVCAGHLGDPEGTDGDNRSDDDTSNKAVDDTSANDAEGKEVAPFRHHSLSLCLENEEACHRLWAHRF